MRQPHLRCRARSAVPPAPAAGARLWPARPRPPRAARRAAIADWDDEEKFRRPHSLEQHACRPRSPRLLVFVVIVVVIVDDDVLERFDVFEQRLETLVPLGRRLV